jgi:signal transduction histidine kinase
VKDYGPRRWRSLTWRLAAAYSLTTLLIVAALGLGLHSLTAYYLDGQLDSELEAQADFYVAYAIQLARDETTLAAVAPTIVSLFAPQSDLNVRFFSASTGTLLAATRDLGPEPSREALLELGYRSPSLFTRSSLNLPHRRYEATPVTVGEQTIGVVEVSRSTSSIEGFLATLRLILLVVVVAAVFVSVVISMLLARQLSKPISDMEQATGRIAGGDLDVRLRRYPSNELGRLAESINRMAERLKSLEQARARFFSEISHDLRTPLTAIKGTVVNLIDDTEPGSRSSLETLEREMDRLIRLVNQLLDFSRWQGDRLTLDLGPTDVGDVCSMAVELTTPVAEHRGISVETDIQSALGLIHADADRLQRVVLNLLDNAIKFTPSGGRITLAVHQKTGEVEISVRDTGRGMTPQEVAGALESDRGSPAGGGGLGLTIARAIVEAHGGRMGIESSPGQGSLVWLTLPCNNCSTSSNAEVTPWQHGPGRVELLARDRPDSQ